MNKQSYKVKIISIEKDRLIRSIKTIREITGVGIADAKSIVESVPVVLMEGLHKNQAIKLKNILERSKIGAIIEIDGINKPKKQKLKKLNFKENPFISFYNNMKGHIKQTMNWFSKYRKNDYKKLLDKMLLDADSFSLVVRDTIQLDKSGRNFLDKLHSFLIEEKLVSKWPGTELLNGEVRMFRYKLNNQSKDVLLEVNGLLAWLQPEFPEDLTFYKEGKPIFVSITHEKDYWYVE